jgi:hypothetical protein
MFDREQILPPPLFGPMLIHPSERTYSNMIATAEWIDLLQFFYPILYVSSLYAHPI